MEASGHGSECGSLGKGPALYFQSPHLLSPIVLETFPEHVDPRFDVFCCSRQDNYDPELPLGLMKMELGLIGSLRHCNSQSSAVSAPSGLSSKHSYEVRLVLAHDAGENGAL